jgi:hypothetical protein
MFRILRTLVLTVVLLIIAFVLVGFFLPTEYRVRRTIEIDAPPEVVHTYVGDLKKWGEWTPWKEMDPALEVTLGDKTTGVGATQSWSGADGSGSLEFKKSSAQDGVEFAWSLQEGEYQCDGALQYAVANGKTNVEWSMAGDFDIPVVGGYFRWTMDALVGPTFERGLEKLKNRVEGKIPAIPEVPETPKTPEIPATPEPPTNG